MTEGKTMRTLDTEPDDEIDGYNQYGVPYIASGDARGTFVRCLNHIAAEGGCNVIRHAETDVAQMVLMATKWQGANAFLIGDVREITESIDRATRTMRDHGRDPAEIAKRIRGLADDGDMAFERGWLCMRDERHGRTEYIIAEVTTVEIGIAETAATLTQRLSGDTH